MFAAYDALPETLRRRVDGLTLRHDSTTNSGGYLRQGYEAPHDLATSPGTMHPPAITHPRTGRRALLLGRRLNAYIPGPSVAESEAPLDEIGRTPCGRNWRGVITGGLAIWSSGTTAGPCTAPRSAPGIRSPSPDNYGHRPLPPSRVHHMGGLPDRPAIQHLSEWVWLAEDFTPMPVTHHMSEAGFERE